MWDDKDHGHASHEPEVVAAQQRHAQQQRRQRIAGIAIAILAGVIALAGGVMLAVGLGL